MSHSYTEMPPKVTYPPVLENRIGSVRRHACTTIVAPRAYFRADSRGFTVVESFLEPLAAHSSLPPLFAMSQGICRLEQALGRTDRLPEPSNRPNLLLG